MIPRKLSKEEVKGYRHFLTVGKLKEFLNEHDLPDDAKVLIQRVEDVYYDDHDWGVYLKVDSIFLKMKMVTSLRNL